MLVSILLQNPTEQLLGSILLIIVVAILILLGSIFADRHRGQQPQPKIKPPATPDDEFLDLLTILRRTRSHRTNIYFVGSQEVNAIKIGITTDYRKRVKALQTANPHALLFLAVIRGSEESEAAIKMRFAHLRTSSANTEWFKADKTLIRFILAAQAADLEPDAWETESKDHDESQL